MSSPPDVQEDEDEMWRVRTMAANDLPGVIALAAAEPAAPHWPPPEYHRMLEVAAASPDRRAAWVLIKQTAFEAVDGFSMATHVAGLCELEVVIIRTTLRGRRLGTLLIKAAAQWGASLNAQRLQLEVRASNAPALRLYQRMGFAVDGTRPGYYHNPEEDALLMSLWLAEAGPEAR